MIDPNNTDHLIAGANRNHYYYSDNGGYLWHHGYISSTYGVIGDPCVVVDTLGNFYFFHLSDPPGPSRIDRVVCHKQTEFGGEWSNGTFAGYTGIKQTDKDWAAVDRVTNNIYVTWTEFDVWGSSDPNHYSKIFLSRSKDSGLTWSDPVRVTHSRGDATGGHGSLHISMPAAGPNGEVYVTWLSPEGIMINKSLNEGSTWKFFDKVVTSLPAGWLYNLPGVYNRGKGFPILACDNSQGPYRGNIYINWTDQRKGRNDTDVWLVKSTNGGSNWGPPKRVNDDPPGKHQFFTWLTVDQTNGYLYCVFYDRRNHDESELLTDVYMAVSTDGGESFTNFKISESPFEPDGDIFYGDYINLTAHNNIIRPIWTRMDGSALSLWTAIVDPQKIPGMEEIFPESVRDDFDLVSAYPNPFNSTVTIKYSLLKYGSVNLKVHDVLGKEIEALIQRKQAKGEYRIDWNAQNNSSGVYFIQLTFDGFIKTKKVVLAK